MREASGRWYSSSSLSRYPWVRDMRRSIGRVIVHIRLAKMRVLNFPARLESDAPRGKPDRVDDSSLASAAYAAFFTEAERDEIGTFGELSAHERARWASVAAHISRTVASPIDEDLAQWRAEQQTILAEQVGRTLYSPDLWRAMMRTTDLQNRVETLRVLLEQSRASAAMARSHSRWLASSAQALEHPMWSDGSVADGHTGRDRGPDDVEATGDRIPADITDGIDRSLHYHEWMVRSLYATGGE